MIIYEFEIKKVDLNLSEVHEICDAGVKLHTIQQIDSAWMVVMSHWFRENLIPEQPTTMYNFVLDRKIPQASVVFYVLGYYVSSKK